MSCLCDLKIDFKGSAKELFEKVKALIAKAGGTITGDEKSGSFSVPIPFSKVAGTYKVTGQTVEICITSKPFFISCKDIENFVKKVLSSVEGVVLEEVHELLPQADAQAQAGNWPTECCFTLPPTCPPQAGAQAQGATGFPTICCITQPPICPPQAGAQAQGATGFPTICCITQPPICPPQAGAQAQGATGFPTICCITQPPICPPQAGAQAQAPTITMGFPPTVCPPCTPQAGAQAQTITYPTVCGIITVCPPCPPQAGAQAQAQTMTNPTVCFPITACPPCTPQGAQGGMTQGWTYCPTCGGPGCR